MKADSSAAFPLQDAEECWGMAPPASDWINPSSPTYMQSFHLEGLGCLLFA